MNSDDFGLIDDVEIVNAASDVDQSKMTELSEGDIIAFETASTSSHASKKGLIKVNIIKWNCGNKHN